MQLPSAMPTVRSILFLRAIAIAEPLSAAPPTIARRTIPMKTCDIPSAVPVPSAAPTRISLIHAARSDAATRLPIARAQAPVRAVVGLVAARISRELVGMGLEHEDEVEAVGREQHDGEADVEQRFLPHGLLGREEAAERAGHGQADRRQEHHGAVDPRGRRLVALVVKAQPADQERDAEREQQVREDRADDARRAPCREAPLSAPPGR